MLTSKKKFATLFSGHSENGVSTEYGSGYYLKTLNEAVQKITYEGLKLPILQKIKLETAL